MLVKFIQRIFTLPHSTKEIVCSNYYKRGCLEWYINFYHHLPIWASKAQINAKHLPELGL